MFAIFEAKDTTTNLHVALDRFQGDIKNLNGKSLIHFSHTSMHSISCRDYTMRYLCGW